MGKGVEKQGIVSILRSDCERSKAASLRRTLSADMSSKTWLAQNGFSPMKKIASSEQLATFLEDPSSSSSEDEDKRPGQFEIWNAIQSQEKNKNDVEKSGQFDIWSSILNKKAEENSGPPPPPYVPPLVKRSASSLSEKSLEICTESLGSETGSDGFSSSSDAEEEEETQALDKDEVRVVKYNYAMCKKPPQRSFPPPLLSLSRRDDGPSLHMRSHRKNGRLVLEAVSVPSQNYFHAQREDGRLVLTFTNNISSDDEKQMNEEEFEEEFVRFDEEEAEELEPEPEPEPDVEEVEEEKEYKETKITVELQPKMSSGVINVHAPPLMMKKLMGLAYRSTTWPHKFNKVIDFETNEEEPTLVPKSLPSPPRMARLLPTPPSTASASFNPYDYCWRTKPVAAAASALSPPFKNNTNKSILSKSNPKGAQDYFVPLVKGCKEARRSLLIWESYCIATT